MDEDDQNRKKKVERSGRKEGTRLIGGVKNHKGNTVDHINQRKTSKVDGDVDGQMSEAMRYRCTLPSTPRKEEEEEQEGVQTTHLHMIKQIT